MIGITYPGITTEERALTGIITIDSNRDYDTIHLGSNENILLGFINQNDGYFEFVPESQIENPYPKRSAYQGCFGDIMTHIANDLELAIEFTVLVYHKQNKEYK